MKVVNVGFLLFLIIPFYAIDIDSDLSINEDDFRTIPVGFDQNAVEITYSTYIDGSTYVDGNLTVAGTITPTPAIGTAKQRTITLTAVSFVNRTQTGPDKTFLSTYGLNNRPVPAWFMFPSTTTQKYLGTFFGIPINIDTTVNPTVDLYIGVDIEGQPAGRMANFAIDVNYVVSGGIIGISSPATGITQSVSPADLTITEPTGANNIKVYKVSATLTGSFITPGCCCGLFLSRFAPFTGTEYAADLFFIAANFNFSVT
jgi:hypothetical protein